METWYEQKELDGFEDELEIPTHLFTEVAIPEKQDNQVFNSAGLVKKLDSAVFEAKVHAILRRCAVYPPQFESNRERYRVERLVCYLITSLELYLERYSPAMTWRDLLNLAELYKAAYNLDLRYAYDNSKYSWLREFFGLSPRLEVLKAYTYYERTLLLRPDDPEVHWKYGEFLLGIPGNELLAKEHLERAVNSGLSDAALELALCYQQLGQIRAAIHCLETHCSRVHHEKVAKFLDSLRQLQQSQAQHK
jgi:tetratricopeptide (TPR) repeat protein